MPRGFPKSAAVGALLFGALIGSFWTQIVPPWIAGAILLVLVVSHLIYKHRSDRIFEQRMAALEARGMDWNTDEDS